MRRAITTTTAFAASISPQQQQQQKRHLWFTQQNDQLQEAVDSKGWKSDIWVGDNELKFRGVQVQDKFKYIAFQVKLPQVTELYNIAELWDYSKAGELGIASDHSSIASRKTYTGQWADELEERAQARAYTNKWWIGAGMVKKEGIQLKKGAKSCLVKTVFPTTVYNLDQLVDPAPLLDSIVSGGTGKRLGGDALPQHRKQNNFSTGIYFTEGQMKQLGLSAKPGASPYNSEVRSTDFLLYNLSDCQDWEQFIDERELRVPRPSEPTYIAGNAIKAEHVLGRIKDHGEFPTNLWVTHNEMKPNGLVLKDAATAKSVDARNLERTGTYQMYNMDDLTEPDVAKQNFGCFVR